MKAKKFILIFFLVTPLFIFSSSMVRGEQAFQSIPNMPTVFKLLEKQTELDGKKITFHGELIGQPIFDQHGVFVNVMDNEFNALGIYLDKNMLVKFTHYGRHGQKGDYVQTTGIFHKVCAVHGGDTDLHATEITVLKAGKSNPEPIIPTFKVVFCFILLVLAIVLYLSAKQRRIKQETF